jgi:hypothetical protein
MKSRIMLVLAVVLMLSAAFVWAANVNGKWESERPGMGGGEPMKTTYVFKAEGSKLTGTVTSPGFMGGEPTVSEITDGKIEGDNITFVVTRKMGEMEMKSTYKGVVTGDEIKFTVERPAMGGMGGPGGGMGGPGGAPGGGMGGPGGAPGGGMGAGPGGPGGGQSKPRGPQEIIAKRVK